MSVWIFIFCIATVRFDVFDELVSNLSIPWRDLFEVVNGVNGHIGVVDCFSVASRKMHCRCICKFLQSAGGRSRELSRLTPPLRKPAEMV